jgi:predicted O-methyltransferase YrrM
MPRITPPHLVEKVVATTARTGKTSAASWVALSLAFLMVIHVMRGQGEQNPLERKEAKIETKVVCEEGITYRKPGLPPLKNRNELGALLESRGLQTGAEVGVQTGYFSQIVLNNWPSCTKFYLIDLWKHQENYHDFANVADHEHQSYFEEAKTKLQPFENKTTFLRMTSVEAASHVPNQTLDYVYIDARHDFCGVTEDLNAYWPKLRPGGIMAGYEIK